MENFIIVDFRGSTKVSITQKAMENLKSYRPNGCPFENYSMLDLLKDWVNMYSWQMVQRNKQIPLVDFIKNINGDGKVLLYGQTMIDLLVAWTPIKESFQVERGECIC